MKRSLVPHVLALVAGLALAAPALSEPIYMKYDGIDGSATVAGRPGFIEVQSYSLGAIEQQVAKAAPRGGANIPVSMSSIQITKRLDATSPKLVQASTKGHHFPTAVIAIIKPGEARPYLTLHLSDVLISSYQTGGSGERPMESLSLNFTKITADFKPQGSPARALSVKPQAAPAAAPVH